MNTDAAPSPPLEQPRTGGSFVRQGDGTLTMIEGAIADAAPIAAPSPDPALAAQLAGEFGEPVTDQSEG